MLDDEGVAAGAFDEEEEDALDVGATVLDDAGITPGEDALGVEAPGLDGTGEAEGP